MEQKSSVFQPLRTLLAVSVLSALGLLWLNQACAQPDFSVLSGYLPDSLQSIYNRPSLADDDVIFAEDSTGIGLFAGFASNDSMGRVMVITSQLPRDSALVWLSEEIPGRMEYLYAADINNDGSEELVLSTRKLGADGWSRLTIWSWGAGSAGSASSVQRCDESAPAYFSAPTRARATDTNGDGNIEIELSAISPEGNSTIIYYWTKNGYCQRVDSTDTTE